MGWPWTHRVRGSTSPTLIYPVYTSTKEVDFLDDQLVYSQSEQSKKLSKRSDLLKKKNL